MISDATRTTKLASITAIEIKPGVVPALTFLGDVRLGRG